jgi:hypothetical protein
LKSHVLGKAKVSGNMTIALISEVRPFLEVKPGDHIVFLQNQEGHIVIEKQIETQKKEVT